MQAIHESAVGLTVRAESTAFEDGQVITVRRWQPVTRFVVFEGEYQVHRCPVLSRGGQFHVTHGPGYGVGDLPAEWGDTDYELRPVSPQREGDSGRPALEYGRPRYE